MRMPVCTECRLRLQTTSSGSKLQLERGLWAGDPALRSRIPGVSTYGGVQETSGLWESVVETLWGGANSTLCSGIVRLWSFLPLYCSEIGRPLFLINKNLKLSSLHPTFWNKDFVSLEIYLENSPTSLWVHNLYFTPSSQENYTEASQALLCLLQNALQEQGQHILLTDSNLHHPDWSKKRRLYSETANKFQDLMKDLNLDLAIAPFTPTRARSLSEKPCSAIDLSFISSSLSNSLIFSKVALQFFHGSDHRPVLTCLDLDPPRKIWKPERNWRTLDSNLARVECEKLHLPFHFQDKYEVDEYLEYLDNFQKLFPVPLRSRTITSDNHRTLSEVLETKRVSVGNHQNLKVKTHHFG